MRLEPIEKPEGLMMKLAYRMARRRLGTVPGPVKVVYARAPKLALLQYRTSQAEDTKLSIPRSLRHLIHALGSGINGCGFCVDIARALAVEHDVGLEKFEALSEYRTSPLFDDRERAALRYAEEVTRRRTVDDAVFEELRKHWSEREIVEITWVNALSGFYNLINVPLELESDGLCALAQERARP